MSKLNVKKEELLLSISSSKLSPALVPEESVPSSSIFESVPLNPEKKFPPSIVLSGSSNILKESDTADSEIILSPSAVIKKCGPPIPISVSSSNSIFSKSTKRFVKVSLINLPPALVLEESVPSSSNSPPILVSSVSNKISSSKLLTPYSRTSVVLETDSLKIIVNVEARIGEKLSVNPPPRPVPAFGIAAETRDAILTLPNTLNPAGCTAFFNSVK